ncbi:MAG: flagellar basal body P-ring formation chaperone FlgA [Terriglobia bacterium]
MMRFRFIAIIPALFLAASLAAGGQTPRAVRAGQAGPAERVLLQSHVVLHSATLTLADLLPRSAPSTLRKQAAAAPLGAAPQPPRVRVIYRQQLQFLLQDDKSLLAQISIPAEISVERFHRMIARQEVASAIQQALGSGKDGSKDALDLDGLELAAPIYVTDSDPGLRVIRIESDPARHETRFRLWTSKEPGNLPFSVTVPGSAKLPVLVAKHGLAPGDIVSATDFAIEMRPAAGVVAKPLAAADGLAGLEAHVVLRSGQPVVKDDFGRPVLVKPETLATLVVEGNGFRIKTMVTPLQQGVLNQEIRVRNTESRQIVEARVIGRDSLLMAR